MENNPCLCQPAQQEAIASMHKAADFIKKYLNKSLDIILDIFNPESQKWREAVMSPAPQMSKV